MVASACVQRLATESRAEDKQGTRQPCCCDMHTYLVMMGCSAVRCVGSPFPAAMDGKVSAAAVITMARGWMEASRTMMGMEEDGQRVVDGWVNALECCSLS